MTFARGRAIHIRATFLRDANLVLFGLRFARGAGFAMMMGAFHALIRTIGVTVAQQFARIGTMLILGWRKVSPTEGMMIEKFEKSYRVGLRKYPPMAGLKPSIKNSTKWLKALHYSMALKASD